MVQFKFFMAYFPAEILSLLRAITKHKSYLYDLLHKPNTDMTNTNDKKTASLRFSRPTALRWSVHFWQA